VRRRAGPSLGGRGRGTAGTASSVLGRLISCPASKPGPESRAHPTFCPRPPLTPPHRFQRQIRDNLENQRVEVLWAEEAVAALWAVSAAARAEFPEHTPLVGGRGGRGGGPARVAGGRARRLSNL
jgi:hypothetical protein